MAQALDPDALPPFDALPITGEQHGPATLDRDTVARVGEMVASGSVEFPANMDDLVAAFDQERFDTLFRAALDATMLTSKLSTALDNRALALVVTLRQVASTAAPTIEQAGIDPVKLEMYLELAGSRLPDRFSAEQRALLRDEAFMLSPAEVESATGVSANTLAQWRFQGSGPRFVKLGRGKDSVRYPAVALLLWAEARS